MKKFYSLLLATILLNSSLFGSEKSLFQKFTTNAWNNKGTTSGIIFVAASFGAKIFQKSNWVDNLRKKTNNFIINVFTKAAENFSKDPIFGASLLVGLGLLYNKAEFIKTKIFRMDDNTKEKNREKEE